MSKEETPKPTPEKFLNERDLKNLKNRMVIPNETQNEELIKRAEKNNDK